MDSRAVIVASSWFAVAIISAMYLYIGGITLATNIVVALLVVMAFVITFGVSFGLEGMRQQAPPSKTQTEMTTQLKELQTAINELTKKVDAIQKELET